jgi:hypothetical protein
MGASRSCISELSRTFRFLPSYLAIVEQGRVVESWNLSQSRGLRNVETTPINTTRALEIATSTTPTEKHHMRLFLIRHAETVSLLRK